MTHMETVKLSDLRNRLPEYLSRAEAGEEIEVTRRGEVIARLVPPRDRRRAARERLAALRARATVGDVVSPVGDDWNAAG
jgi:prevent-host-death family protein